VVSIAVIVGARPNFVKIAPILAEMRHYPELQPTLIHTGQHYDDNMSASFFRDLDIPAPDVHLNVKADSSCATVADIVGRLGPLFVARRPRLVLVVGDVDSTLAAALAAAKTGFPLAHVEAGLRSFDRRMPEEINRIITDSVADYCFTTEPSANDNLAREGVAASRIHFVGNVMIDTLFRFRQRSASSRVMEALGLSAGRFALLTLHRPSNVDVPATLAGVLRAIESIARDVPVVFPVHPRTRHRLGAYGRELAPDVRLLDPLPYLDFINLMDAAACALTDSGGVQEETTALGVPCLTLRTSTERPITTTCGTNRIVGVDAEAISAAWADIRRGAWPAHRMPPLWDGRAAERLVKVLAAIVP
jgi:UDP-N-acetylglucosamine 2-epimerase (non-hydrolysing)